MKLSGKRVAILVDNYFEQSEFEEPYSALKNAGAEVTVIAAKDKKLQALQHVDKGDMFTADLLLKNAEPDDYDALVLPGGAINADSLRVIEKAQSWVVEFLDSNKPLAVICHAPWVLISADIVEDRRLTSFQSIQDDIRNAGGEWLDQAVVVDDNLITSRKPDDLPKFNQAIIDMLSKQPTESLADVGNDDPKSHDDTSSLSDREIEDEARLRAQGYDKSRDQLSEVDKKDILLDQDEEDPDQAHLSSVVSEDERDD